MKLLCKCVLCDLTLYTVVEVYCCCRGVCFFSCLLWCFTTFNFQYVQGV